MAFYDYFAKGDVSSISQIGRLINHRQNKFFLDLIKAFSKAHDISLLEIGPGKGYFAEKCVEEERIRYTGIEANKLMYEEIKCKGYNVYHDFVPPIKLNEKFDVIFMNQVFEHMRGRNEALELMQSCKDHLNASGLLIISSPDILVWKEDFYCDYTHNYPTSMTRLTQILSDYDFEVLYTKYYSFFVKGYIPTRIVAFVSRLSYSLGFLRLFFSHKDYKVKTSLFPSCLVIGGKK